MFDFFKKKPKAAPQKATTDIVFEKAVCEGPASLRMQGGEFPVDCWETVQNRLFDLFDDPDEFLVLTLPEIRHGIRFVQACPQEDKIFVELGLEDDDKTRLVNKTCTDEECIEIFREFYTTSAVQGLEQYAPSEFFVS